MKVDSHYCIVQMFCVGFFKVVVRSQYLTSRGRANVCNVNQLGKAVMWDCFSEKLFTFELIYICWHNMGRLFSQQNINRMHNYFMKYLKILCKKKCLRILFSLVDFILWSWSPVSKIMIWRFYGVWFHSSLCVSFSWLEKYKKYF